MKSFQLQKFSELSNQDLYAILKMRQQIFGIEQNCLYLDLDDLDQVARHLFLYGEGGEIICSCRIFAPGDCFKESSIGRVVTLKEQRGKGLARTMMLEAIAYLFSNYPDSPILISAQQYLIDFYGSLGFKEIGELYFEDHLPHIKMILYKEAALA